MKKSEINTTLQQQNGYWTFGETHFMLMKSDNGNLGIREFSIPEFIILFDLDTSHSKIQKMFDAFYAGYVMGLKEGITLGRQDAQEKIRLAIGLPKMCGETYPSQGHETLTSHKYKAIWDIAD